jgi:hypothetical protein
MLPRLLGHQSEMFDGPEVFQIELDILPEAACRPAVEIVHLNQHPQLAVLHDQALDFGDEMLVVLLRELACEFDHQDPSPRFFVQID